MTYLFLVLRCSLLATIMSSAIAAAETAPVRGVWVAGPQHNHFWDSRESMRAELRQFKRAGFNRIYAVALLPGRTLYPSGLMEQLTGQRQLEILGQRDALRELLDEATPLGLSVVAWLETGFASHFGEGDGAGLLRYRPAWAGLDRDGRPVVRNGFHWLNAFDPEVQQLLIDLSVELLRRYPDLAGVQGDDRLPASPSSGGYHPSVLSAYGWNPGQELPHEHDARWVQFRADLLTSFLTRWRAAVKAERPTAILSLSPSPFPWGLQQYLQDWPTWMRLGLVDELLPQLYRRTAADYELLLNETKALVPADQLDRVFPGMLLALGSEVVPSREMLSRWIASTRAAGFRGEVQFHSAGIDSLEAVFRAAYVRGGRVP